MLVALVVPILRATAVAVSRVGVRMLVSARPVPLIQKLAVVCCMAFWFCMKFVAVGAITDASHVERTPTFVHKSVVLEDACGVMLSVPWIVVVVAARPMVTPLALVVPIETVPAVVVAVPVSIAMLPLAPADALPVEIVVSPEVAPAVLVTVVPPAPWRVRAPAFVPQVAAAALVSVSAPVLVVKLLAALDVMLTAPAVAEPMVVVLVPVVLMLVVPATVFVLPVMLVVPVVLPMVVLPVPVLIVVAAEPEPFMVVVPSTVVVPVRPIVPPDWIDILPAAPLPILTAPVLVPVFIFVLKLLEAFKSMLAPLTVSPVFIVTLPEKVLSPANV